MGCLDENLKEELEMSEIIILLLIVAAWYLFQAYILPKMGVDT